MNENSTDAGICYFFITIYLPVWIASCFYLLVGQVDYTDEPLVFVIGEYKVCGRIGKSSNSTVFKGVHKTTGKEVSVCPFLLTLHYPRNCTTRLQILVQNTPRLLNENQHRLTFAVLSIKYGYRFWQTT